MAQWRDRRQACDLVFFRLEIVRSLFLVPFAKVHHVAAVIVPWVCFVRFPSGAY